MYKICIDPGHGGTDPGAVNGAAYEKDIVLDVALKLKKLLLNSGFDVVLTRETDVFDTPVQKAKIANASAADLFLSIHCNSYRLETAHGTETLYYPGAVDSEKFAKALQEQLVTHLQLTDRGIKARKELAVLNTTKMTAALVEIAFLSNPNEKRLLLNSGFRSHIAQALFDGIQDYLKEMNIVIPAPKKEPTMAQKKAVVKKEYNFEANTMKYLEGYEFADALIERLYEKVKGA